MDNAQIYLWFCALFLVAGGALLLVAALGLVAG